MNNYIPQIYEGAINNPCLRADFICSLLIKYVFYRDSSLKLGDSWKVICIVELATCPFCCQHVFYMEVYITRVTSKGEYGDVIRHRPIFCNLLKHYLCAV